MNTIPKPAKRIVSKKRYLQALGGKSLLMVYGMICGIAMIFWTVDLWRLLYSKPNSISLLALVFAEMLVTVMCGVGIYVIVSVLLKLARQIDIGIPLTRANTADLPAPDSLVRAASEPAHAQKAVLLRPAANERERHEE